MELASTVFTLIFNAPYDACDGQHGKCGRQIGPILTRKV